VPQAEERQEGSADQIDVGVGGEEQREDQVFRAEEKQEDCWGGGVSYALSNISFFKMLLIYICNG